jgi:hypothetical protein
VIDVLKNSEEALTQNIFQSTLEILIRL